MQTRTSDLAHVLYAVKESTKRHDAQLDNTTHSIQQLEKKVQEAGRKVSHEAAFPSMYLFLLLQP